MTDEGKGGGDTCACTCSGMAASSTPLACSAVPGPVFHRCTWALHAPDDLSLLPTSVRLNAVGMWGFDSGGWCEEVNDVICDWLELAAPVLGQHPIKQVYQCSVRIPAMHYLLALCT